VKPRLTYLRPPVKDIPERFHHFLLHNTLRWLEEYFDVFSIELIRKQRIEVPDLTEVIFLQVIPELGWTDYEYVFERRNIPLVVYLSMDSISPSRYAVFTFAKELKADAYFTNDLSMGFRYPKFRNKLFYLPWFVLSKDLSAFHEVNKDIFMLLVGHNNGTYPWRNTIFPKLRNFYPVEQLAYFNKYGKDYLHLLSMAKYIPTDGGFGRILVNKHFEIPASFSCLITQPSEAVSVAGFKDMTNCIMAENFDEIVRKVEICEKRPEVYSSIVKNGYELVLNHHTEKNRPQLYEWYLLYKDGGKEEKILQTGPFDQLILGSSPYLKCFDLHFTDDAVITREIDNLIERKDYHLAYQKCEFLINEYLEYSPDFLVRKAIVCLHTNKLREAVKSLWRLMNFELYFTRARKPEPVEWSLLLLLLFFAGRSKAVKGMISMFEFETEPFFNYVKFFILSSVGNRQLASTYLARSFAVDGKSESAHTIVPSKVEQIQRWIEDIAETLSVPRRTITSYSDNRKTNHTPLYKYFLIEYFCLVYSDGHSLKNQLKSRARLTRNLLKSLKNKPLFQ
jgi:hypothetical protein